MIHLDEGLKVYLHRAPVDFRLSINGLATLVQQALGLDPFAACVYVFSNRRRNRVKVLGWDRNGFWLLLKRLEEDRFIWPSETAVPFANGRSWRLLSHDRSNVLHTRTSTRRPAERVY